MASFMKNMQPFSVVELFADPPVKITGRPDAVSMAADRIRAELDPLDNPNRVSLKMEVSWTDHSHIIGREGRSIKSVSTLTNCHIHFPDSNRFSETEKCNQVSIAGDPQAVETARAQVRILSPVIFAFEIPFATEIQSILESRQSPQMQYIQNAYNVQIIVRNKGRPGTVALVKGNSWELDKVKVATRALMQHLCQGETEAMMYLEISPHYHSSVLGSNGASAVRAIMAVTGTTIVWPNLADTSLHPLRKATFVISGQLDKVYAAREMLIGSLPLVLMADLPQGLDLEMEKVQHVMTMMKVTVSTRPKNKNGVLYRTLVIRGSERHVDHLYEARRILLGLPHDARIHCRVPESYHVPPAPPSVPLQPPLPIHTLPLLPIPSSSGGYNRYSPDEPPTSLLGWYPTATGSPSTPSPGHQSHGAFSQGSYPYHHYPYFTPTDNSKMFCSVNSWLYPDRRSSMGHTPVNTRSYASHGSNCGSDWNASGNESKFSSSFMTSTGGTDASSSNSLSSSSYSLFSASNNSGSSTSPTHTGLHGLRGPNAEKMGGVDCHDMATGLDYNTRRALASRAMSQEVNPDVPRTPTTAWSGMGFSKSHTAALLAMNRSGFALGSSPTSTTLEEKEPPKTPGYSAVKTNSSSDEDKAGDGNQKEGLVGNSGCRVANTSGSLSSMGSMASSQHTSMSPSYVNRASTAEWRSSWSDFETEDCSINESLFLSGKASVGSFGSPEKHPHDSTSSISGLAACLAGMNTSAATLTGSENQKGSISSITSIDTNNNADGSKHSPGGGGGRVSLSSTGSPPILSTMNNPPGTPRPQSTSQMNFSSSNVIDGVVPLPRPITRGNDLCDLLAKLNLSKYYEFFREQDIDITTFVTLTESDLVRLGISTFGARRKILVAIRDVREHGGPVFSGSAAVGAERRPSNY